MKIISYNISACSLTLRLKNPSIEDYEKNGCQESARLLRLVRRICDFANGQGMEFEWEE